MQLFTDCRFCAERLQNSGGFIMKIPVLCNKRWKPHVFLSREVIKLYHIPKTEYCCFKNEKVFCKLIWNDV